MLRSSTQLVKSHGDDLGLEYLWNGDEYGALENSLKAMKMWMTIRNLEILAQVHVIKRRITVHYEDSDKGTVFGEFLMITLAYTFFIIQKNLTTKEN